MAQTFNFMNESVDVAGVGTPQEQVVRRYTNPAPTATPTVPTPAPTTTNLLAKPTLGTVDENAVREQTRQRMQSSIDAINANFANLIAREKVVGEDRSGQTRAVNARSGLMGSDFGNAQTEKTHQFNQSQVKALEDEKTAQVNSVLLNIEDRASAEIRMRKEEALGKYNREMGEYEKTQEMARNDLKTLATSGVDLNKLNPAQKSALFKQAGYEDESMGELIFNSLKPKQSQIDYQFANLGNGKALFYGVDPATGELKQQMIETSNPQADLVIGIISKYPDAGITLDDDLATAQQKIQNSRIYRDQVRPPVSAGGSSSASSAGSAPTAENPQGLSPQAQAVMNGTLKLEDLTPTMRGQIAGELTSAGYTRTANITAGQREQIDKLDTLIREANSAQTILESGIDTGPLASRLKAGAAIFGGAQEFTQYRSVINNLSSILLQARSGAAVTPEEFERIRGFIPLANDDERTAKTKVQRFLAEMSAARENYIRRSTQTPAQIRGSDSAAPDAQSLREKYNY